MHAPTIGLLAAALLACAATVGCEKDKQSDSAGTTTAAAPVALPLAVPPPSTNGASHVELQIASVADTMTFDKTALAVPAGARVHLTFKNNATSTTLPHNWVLVRPGKSASVATAGLKEGEKAGYVDVDDHDIIAFTPLAKAGESTDVTFPAPEPGAYPYVCTVPGHYVMMKGVLTVAP